MPEEKRTQDKEDVLTFEDLAEKLPLLKEEKEELITKVHALAVSRQYSGPLPPMEMNSLLEENYQGATKILVDDLVKESSHQWKMDESFLAKDFDFRKSGQTKGFIVQLMTIIGAFSLLLMGRPVEGFVAILIPSAI